MWQFYDRFINLPPYNFAKNIVKNKLTPAYTVDVIKTFHNYQLMNQLPKAHVFISDMLNAIILQISQQALTSVKIQQNID